MPQSFWHFPTQEFIAGDITVVQLIGNYYNHRLLMAALHFNENYNREQAKTRDGKERIKIAFPKQKRGEFTPKPVPVSKTYRKLFTVPLQNYLKHTYIRQVMLMNSLKRPCISAQQMTINHHYLHPHLL